MLDLWFRRFQNLPLSIDLLDPMLITRNRDIQLGAATLTDGFDLILKAIVMQSRRWKRISLTVRPCLFHGEWWTHLNADGLIPVLETCLINASYNILWISRSTSMRDLLFRFNASSAPLLHDITSDSSWYTHMELKYPLGSTQKDPFQRCTRLEGHLEMLTGCIHLRECTIAHVRGMSPD